MQIVRPTLGALSGALCLVLAASPATNASVPDTPDDTGQTVGGAFGLAMDGDRVIIGGRFTRFGGEPRSNVAAMLPDGSADPTFDPGTDGQVEAVAVSEDGSTVFIGGLFTTAGGATRANLAAVEGVTGEAISTWQADTTGTNPVVNSLAVSGNTLYVSGRFAGIDGTTRKRLVAIDTSTGVLVNTFKPAPNGGVREVVVHGDKLYVGGGFTAIGGPARPASAAELMADTGAATAFNPIESGGGVVTVEVTPDGSRFFFSTDNNTVFAYDPAVSNDPVWSRKMSGNTQAMAASATGELYLGGHFSQDLTTKSKRPFYASLYWDTGSLTPWNPNATGSKSGVWALLIDREHLHTGGFFRYFGAEQQIGYARFTGTP